MGCLDKFSEVEDDCKQRPICGDCETAVYSGGPAGNIYVGMLTALYKHSSVKSSLVGLLWSGLTSFLSLTKCCQKS